MCYIAFVTKKKKKILIPTGLTSTELDFEVAGDPY